MGSGYVSLTAAEAGLASRAGGAAKFECLANAGGAADLDAITYPFLLSQC